MVRQGLDETTARIVEADDPRLSVVAGPGTGKTFALMRRVQRLLAKGVTPQRILVVTFTRTAADDLLKELRNLGVEGSDKIRASTLHAYCFSILSRERVFQYLGRKARPLVTVNKSGIMQFEGAPLLEDIGLDHDYGSKRNRTERIRAYEAAWARLQHETPGWPSSEIDRQFGDSLAAWLGFHEAIMIGELIPLTLKYLRDNPACDECKAFDHVLVDEYQDLNKAEQSLVDLLAERGTLTVVGDPDQSIYSFRYAWPEGILEFPKNHPDTHTETLSECRRCPKQVVALANNLIAHNYPHGLQTGLTPKPDNSDGVIRVVQWSSLDEEVKGLGQYVQHLIQNRGYQPGEVLILAPRRLIGQRIWDELANKAVHAQSYYYDEALEEDAAQRAFALLTLLANRNDRVALRFLLGVESPTWLSREYAVLRQYCVQSGDSPWAALQKKESGAISLARTSRLSRRFRHIVAELADLDSPSDTALVDRLFPANQSWAKALRESALPEAGQVDPGSLLEVLRGKVTQPDIPQTADFVRIMSLHKSKGLKSRVVIIAGCVQGLIPNVGQGSTTAASSEEDLKEQRRLFYVGITRTTETLVLSSAIYTERRLLLRMAGPVVGGRQITSQFIDELGPTAPRCVRGSDWRQQGFA